MSHTVNSESINLMHNQLDVAFLVLDRDTGMIRHVNLSVCKAMGKDFGEIVGQHYRTIFWPEFITVYDRLQEECRDGKEHTTIYYWGEMAIWEQISARMIIWEGKPSVLMAITNISDIARTEYRLESIAYFDNLLKLPNGAKLEEDINDLASFETVALIFFEIDRLVELNVIYGWDNGDGVLKQIRDYLLFSESRRTQLYRVNNGFAIMGRKVTLDEAKSRAREILERFQRPWTITAGGNAVSLYCSIKLCVVYGKYVQNEMRNLMLRTLHVPECEKRGFVIYDQGADEKIKRSLMLRDSLINCVHNQMAGFSVHYQPIVDIRTERWVAVEALCRWTAPNGDRISPLEFIHAAEQLNLIARLDSWVRKTAMAECQELRLNRKSFILDVNFSSTSRVDEFFIGDLLAGLRSARFPADRLNLEITESAKMVFDEANLEGLNRIREIGILLSLDDFGTGYSSLANLIHISAKALKTEKLFLANIENDSYRQYLLRMLIDLAHYHKMDFIAEGVETREQLELLRTMGVDFVQGFLFSKPMPREQLAKETGRFD